MDESTLNTIFAILRENYSIEGPLNADSLVSEIGIDSVDLIGFLFELEERTGVKIPDDALEGFAKLGDFADFVDEHRKAN